MPDTFNIDYHVPIVGQHLIKIPFSTLNSGAVKISISSEKRNLSIRFTLISNNALDQVRAACLGIIEKISIGLALQQRIILGIPNETAAQQIPITDLTTTARSINLSDNIGITDSVELTISLDESTAPTVLSGYLTDRAVSSVYGQLFLEAMRLQHPVAKFISLYHIVLLLCGSDAQADVDNYIIRYQPTVQMEPLPAARVRGARTHETIHTKLRNELLHSRLGTAVEFGEIATKMHNNISILIQTVVDGIRSIT